ncbi:serine/arginine repetitive matrix protein 1 isoform X2 [Thrips palmi]|uniref:Serine/arginine repetitive matrix protein 1 isoform X2 n=1 Tax=Thrips palmi TaxID=161013 RepID=A0A6P8YZ83_THRPL|nr:serine/arginine repetitive matrix protein 1 isoform X2 [Thrips palmi]
MTEVVIPAQQVISVRRYEAAPVSPNSQLVDPDNLQATNKEEEWVTKKKTELTTTKQIETRVKRHVVLEDGKVVDDSGPIVTTNTTEDTEKQEHQHTEHRTHGDDPPSGDEGWVAVPGPGGMVREVKEKKVRSREEKEERQETEDIHHLGDITDEGYLAAVRDDKDVRRALLSGKEVVRGEDGQLVVVDPRNSGPRLVHQSSKGRKVVDTENTHEISEVQPDGRVVTEKRRTTEHEEVDEKEDPDDGELEEEDKYRESKQRFRKSKDQELVEYLADGVKVGQEMRYQCENVEGERFGDPAALAVEDQQEWDSLSTRIRRMRRNKLLQSRAAGQLGPAPGAANLTGAAAADRKDALTKRPLDFDQEEETRKVETSKWLEHHFGSESRSSKDSIEDEDDVQRGTTTSFINVTMKSRPVTPRTNGLNGLNTTSSSRVFVSSPEPRSESPYFQGISQWSERRHDRQDRQDVRETATSSWNKKSTFSPSDPTSTAVGSGYTGRPDRVQVLPTGPDHTFKATATSTPVANGGTRLYKTTSVHRVGSPSAYRGGGSSPYRDSPTYSPYRDDSDELPEDEERYRGGSSALRKKDSFRDWPPSSPEYHHGNHHGNHHRGASPSPSPPPMPANKKLYQRTRFAADIPPPSAYSSSSRHPSTPTPPPSAPATVVKSHQQSASQIIGDSFRKLVGKFRSGSSDRSKNKASRKLSNKSRGGSSRSRSPSPTYRAAEGSLLGMSRTKRSKSGRRSAQDGEGSSPNDGTEEGDSPEEVAPVAPPRGGGRSGLKRSQSRSQPHRNGHDLDGRDGRDTVDGEARTTRKYYLGEDPFGGSIYGREREYDGVVPARRKQRDVRRGSQSEEERHSSLGRLSKSTSRLTSSGAATQHNTMLNGGTRRVGTEYHAGRGGSQTLPRKLRDRDDSTPRAKKQVYVTKSNVERTGSSARSSPPQVWEHRFTRERSSPRSSPLASPLTTSPHTGSLINVSFVNQAPSPTRNGHGNGHSNGVSWEGPAKPARTYRTSLTRSKSFNVQAAPTAYRSSSQLHRLEESPPPLKSPSILASISRSTRDLTDLGEKENHVEDLYTKPARRAADQRRLFSSTSHLNGVNSSGGSGQDPKKKAFMRGLLDRAPELFKTLHPEEQQQQHAEPRVIDYSNSFRSSTATPPPRAPFRSMDRDSRDRASPSGGGPASKGLRERDAYRRDSNNSNSNGSGGDYSETVRITSKCSDPLRPSVTNTVQNYSRRTVPSGRGGAREVVETSDTSTVTKRSSRYRGGSGDSGIDTSTSSILMDSKYPRHTASLAAQARQWRHQPDKHGVNGGVVIEVRNTRK